MCNCNQQRLSYNSGNADAPPGMVRIKLVTNKPLTVNGNITGRMYIFRMLNDVIFVDKRDAGALEKITGLQRL